MRLPAYDEIVALHRKHAPHNEAFDEVFRHCGIVADIAEHLIAQSAVDINKDLVRVGCFVHDIGVYKLYTPDGIDHANYIRHGILGYEILKHEGFDEVICRFVAHHTGVGLGKEQIVRRNLPLPHRDFFC